MNSKLTPQASQAALPGTHARSSSNESSSGDSSADADGADGSSRRTERCLLVCVLLLGAALAAACLGIAAAGLLLLPKLLQQHSGSQRHQLPLLEEAPFLKIYIAKLPREFQPREPDKLYSFHALGASVPATNQQLWNSLWHQIDYWINNQLIISPRRTYDAAEADIVVVPLPLLPAFYATKLRSFMLQAPALLPLLGSKPHLLVLSHPLHVVAEKARGVLDLPAAGHFTMLALQAQRDSRYPQLPRKWVEQVVLAPYLVHTHWHRGSAALRAPQQSAPAFDPARIAAVKQRLVMYSANIRNYRQRGRLHGDCAARPQQCAYVNWTAVDGMEAARATYFALQQSWYALQGDADFAIRGAVFQALTSFCIPVFTCKDVEQHLPFSDVLDYRCAAGGAAGVVLLSGCCRGCVAALEAPSCGRSCTEECYTAPLTHHEQPPASQPARLPTQASPIPFRTRASPLPPASPSAAQLLLRDAGRQRARRLHGRRLRDWGRQRDRPAAGALQPHRGDCHAGAAAPGAARDAVHAQPGPRPAEVRPDGADGSR